MTATDDERYSSYMWTAIDSIKIDSGADAGLDSAKVFITPVKGVILGTATTVNLAGVTIESIADNAVGQIAISGSVEVKSKTGSATYIKGGFPVICGQSGTALPLDQAAWTADSLVVYGGRIIGVGMGTKDDVSDSANIWIFYEHR